MEDFCKILKTVAKNYVMGHVESHLTPILMKLGIPDFHLYFENYPKNDEIDTSYTLSNANSAQRQELDQLKTRLDQISQQLADNTGSLNTDEIKVGNQSTLQTQSIGNYLKDYKNTNNKIKKISSSGMEGIINDSDIIVLKENYNYYFWSILAVGTVLVTMNITKQ
jgi:hypothetical protein